MIMGANQYQISKPPSDAISSVKFSDDLSTRLIAASWDGKVYVYDTTDDESGDAKLITKIEHPAPVLDVCFGRCENEIFSAGLDHAVRRLNVKDNSENIITRHTAGVKSVVYSRKHNLLISGAWDLTLNVHLCNNDDTLTYGVIKLPEKPFSLALSSSRLVVAMANRCIHIYDLESLISTLQLMKKSGENGNGLSVEPWQRRESSLRFMTRAVTCMPNDLGYTASSIEGRVAVEWFDSSPESQARKYAFKCHRQTVNDVDFVYPVNSLTFHPVHGSFASGGGDGVVALWDGIAKRRIRQYQRYPSSISSLCFNGNGTRLAIAVSPGFENGKEDPEGIVGIYVRKLSENEAKGKEAG